MLTALMSLALLGLVAVSGVMTVKKMAELASPPAQPPLASAQA